MADSAYTPGVNATALQPFPETGKPKGSRLKDAASLQSIYWQMRQDDSLSSKQRAGIRAVIDGAAPYKESSRRKAGSGAASNLNFGSAKARLDQTLTAYNEMMDSVRNVIEPTIPVGVLDDTQRQNAEEVIADEFTIMLRDWTSFDSRFQLLSKEFIEHGVSLGYFPNDFDWKFDAAGWDNFLIPRDTRADEQFIDILLQTKDETPSDLYRYIQNESAAKEAGWDVEAVKKSLVKATRFAGKQLPSSWALEWDLLNRQIKDNDLFSSYSTTSRVYLVHAWVKEFDGTWSHYIAERDPKGSRNGTMQQEFLYKKLNRFPANSNCFTTFCLNIGNGYYHSIRGQGYAMFPFVQTENKMRNDVINNFRMSMATMIQKKDINALDEAPITVSAGIALVSPEVEFVERPLQNHANSSLAVLHDFSLMMDSVAPVGRGQEVNPGAPVMTKYQIQGTQLAGNSLNNSSINMFYRSWRRLLREMWRRVQEIIAQGRTEFDEVFDFLNRCARRGVTPEMILMVDRVYEVRSIGAGSPGARQATLDRVLGRIGSMDEVGKKLLLHDAMVSDVGPRQAMRYAPLSEKPRPVIDQKVAELESAQMYNGANVDPLDGENHAVHALVHMGSADQAPSIANSIQMLENWRNNGEQGSITDLQPHIAFLSLVVPHTEQHVQAMASDPTRLQEVANLRKGLQEYSAIWMTYVRQLQKVLDEQEQQAREAQQPDPELMLKIEKQRQEMDMSVQKFQLSQQLTVADVQNRMALRTREADVKMATMVHKANAEQAAQLAEPLAPASQSDFVTNRSARTPNR